MFFLKFVATVPSTTSVRTPDAPPPCAPEPPGVEHVQQPQSQDVEPLLRDFGRRPDGRHHEGGHAADATCASEPLGVGAGVRRASKTRKLVA
jgi:hypothetical protein